MVWKISSAHRKQPFQSGLFLYCYCTLLLYYTIPLTSNLYSMNVMKAKAKMKETKLKEIKWHREKSQGLPPDYHKHQVPDLVGLSSQVYFQLWYEVVSMAASPLTA